MVPVNNISKIKVTVEEYIKGEPQTCEVGSLSNVCLFVFFLSVLVCVCQSSQALPRKGYFTARICDKLRLPTYRFTTAWLV